MSEYIKPSRIKNKFFVNKKKDKKTSDKKKNCLRKN